ncbi:MAG: 2-phospho-L-lactate transferase [Gammaproteobacteria bacterium]|nr:2-phospho-L-lactate transferase [Gammaproteobacteria bacterium]
MASAANKKFLAISGGVGGAKLVLGLSRCLATGQLSIVANTGDDFRHHGLHISPDLDTVMYTLAALNDTERGWGLASESWNFLAALETLGGETWFRLGDRDLATHIQRSQLLAEGHTLSQVTRRLCQQLGVQYPLWPMSDDEVSTVVHTGEGALPFQHYFVRRQCEPAVTGFEFAGIDAARPQPDFMAQLASSDLSGVIICPSNPFVSVDPILGLPGVRQALRECKAPVIAVSPIVAGMAIKGPAAKMMAELGVPVTALAVAQHYQGVIDCFVVDESDAKLAASIEQLGMTVAVSSTIMKTLAEREALASAIIELAESAR